MRRDTFFFLLLSVAAGTMSVDVYGEEDLDIDLEDFSVMQRAVTGPY